MRPVARSGPSKSHKPRRSGSSAHIQDTVPRGWLAPSTLTKAATKLMRRSRRKPSHQLLPPPLRAGARPERLPERLLTRQPRSHLRVLLLPDLGSMPAVALVWPLLALHWV